MNNLKETKDKIKFIVGIFKHYKSELTIIEQIALLTLWEESFVIHEEYEMAEAVKKEMKKILLNVKDKQIVKVDSNIKIPLYKKILICIKNIFIKN